MNEWLVAQGLALAYRRYSRDYISAEDEARAAGRGMWAGSFTAPLELAPGTPLMRPKAVTFR